MVTVNMCVTNELHTEHVICFPKEYSDPWIGSTSKARELKHFCRTRLDSGHSQGKPLRLWK